MPEMRDLPADERERVWQDLSADIRRPFVLADELSEEEIRRLKERMAGDNPRLHDARSAREIWERLVARYARMLPEKEESQG